MARSRRSIKRIRGRHSSAMSGYRRSTKTNWPACSNCWGTPKSSWARITPTSKVSPIPRPTSRTWRTSTTPPSSAELLCATTDSSCRSASQSDRSVNVSKSNLVAILLEVGEENAAVLLARSNLPDEIDLKRDLDFLTALGLDRDQVDEVAQLTIGSIKSDDVNGHLQRGEMETTISRRWADLVDQWLT